MAARVIFNADDFGRSPAINAAVIRAHREGVLTSASLMVTGEACEEAVTLARATPTLAVGLHVVVADGRAVLSPSEIPRLVDTTGRFRGSPAQLGMRYVFSRAAQEEMAREMAAQFERFAATGLPLSHVDSHQHMHVVPPVFDRLLPLAGHYGAAGLRLPRDDLGLAWHGGRLGTKVAWAVAFGLLCRRGMGCLRHHRLAVTERVYGLLQTGQMHESYVVELLRRLDVPTAELYFHPSVVFLGEAFGPNPGDLATLLSPAVRQVVRERGLHLTTYRDLSAEV